LTVVFRNIKFMQIFAGVPWTGSVIVIESVNNVSAFGRYIVGILGNKANIIMQYYLVPYRHSTDLKTRDFE